MERITINGIAENSKAGAVVITKDNKVYFIDGLTSWNTEYYQKQIEVQGNLQIQFYDEETVQNENGEYNQGLSGEMKKILEPKYKLYNQVKETDSVIEKLKELLPKNWELKIENEKLIISNNETVYSLFENKINAPVSKETSSQKEERFKKYGQLIKPQFIFILEKKLTLAEINQIKSENNKINISLSKLQKKLKSIPFSAKDGNYRPRNKDEENIISDYERDKSRLESKMIKLPDYQSGKYAMYLESEVGIETEYISIFPGKYSEEMYAIKIEVFEKVLDLVK